MSKITNPKTEASVTCGFYNSLGDRKYDAIQMSSIFNGIINDGIFASIGDCFVTKADSGTIVNVGTGKAWFDSTWTQNDAILPVDCGAADTLLYRIDAIVIEVNSDPTVRDNFIKVVKGDLTAADLKAETSKPWSKHAARPTLSDSDLVKQHVLCYIRRKPDPDGTLSINQDDIENMVGTQETPFITGLLEVISVDELLGQWRSDLDRFVASEKNDIDTFMTTQETEFTEWYNETTELMQNVANEISSWSEEIKSDMNSDLATTFLMKQSTEEIQRLLVSGLNDGVTIISEDGTTITSTDSLGRKLVRTFTNNFLTCTSVLIGTEGGEIGRLVKNFSSDGLTINSEMTVLYDPGVVIVNTLENGDNIRY